VHRVFPQVIRLKMRNDQILSQIKSSLLNQESQLEDRFLLIDFEGYYYLGKFYFKEFGFYKQNTIKTYYIKTKPHFFSNYSWLLEHYHKLPHDFGSTSFKIVLKLLNDQNITILVKGEEKSKIIRQISNNLVLNLENFGCPSFKSLHTNSWPCIYHTIVPAEHCVRIKISKILDWIKNERGTNQISA
jgi:hypothetical protein